MTSEEMIKTKCPPGYWFVNEAPLGAKPNWKIAPLPWKKFEKELCKGREFRGA